MTIDPSRIRNFSIIAHIDHGKSTLADRILEATGALTAREMEAQVLDDMDIERERGITIKARAVSLAYTARDGQEYLFNLIDTPGHVDFSYEVSRSLAACEGVLLVVDAAQGVEAQTLANAHLAIENELEILTVLNKIDLPSARPAVIREQIEHVIGIDAEHAVETSAKSGLGIPELLERIVSDIPPPVGDPTAPLKALLFDSWYDPYRGVMALIRIVDGAIRPGMKVRFISTGQVYEVDQIGVFTPKPRAVKELGVGEVGFLAAGVKDIVHTKIGDTINEEGKPSATMLPGFREAKPMVFAGLFPVNAADYQNLREAIEKLRLNDASISFEPETSAALGFGFRCGFLGLLHMEIIQQRLEREFDLDLINTAPGVKYLVATVTGDVIEVDNPAKLPAPQSIESIEEPYIIATLLAPAEYVGGILKLAEDRRGVQKGLEYISSDRVMITYDLPLNEVILDFYDRLKSISRGYASFDYHIAGYRMADLVKLDVLINGDIIDALSLIVHRDKAYPKGKMLIEKMRELIPRQLFDVVLQAAVGSRIISRETVKATRKDVLAKCYGGDISRKRKLLEKQKEGKKRMKRVGRVDIPQEAFLAVLKVD